MNQSGTPGQPTMTNTTITEELRRLASDQMVRSQTARLRDVLDEVEAAVAAGVSHATILSALNERGFSMTPKSFADTLFRLRKKRAKGAKATTPPPHVQVPASPAAPPQAVERKPGDDLFGPEQKQRRAKLADKYIGEEISPKNSLANQLLRQQANK